MPLEPSDSVTLPDAVMQDMIAHAVAEAPRECCGLLIGEGWQVDESVRATNLEPGTTRYLIDPAEHFAVLKRLRGSSRDVIGAYHSHPRSPAWPSPTDVAECFSALFVYVIISLAEPANPVIKAFRIDGAEVTPLTIVDDGEP